MSTISQDCVCDNEKLKGTLAKGISISFVYLWSVLIRMLFSTGKAISFLLTAKIAVPLSGVLMVLSAIRRLLIIIYYYWISNYK